MLLTSPEVELFFTPLSAHNRFKKLDYGAIVLTISKQLLYVINLDKLVLLYGRK